MKRGLLVSLALTELGAGRIVVAARNHAGPGRAPAAAHRMEIGRAHV